MDILSKSIPEPMSGCWLWPGKSGSNYGYGRVKVGGKRWMVHRLSYHQNVGPIPPGMVVMHSCDNVACVNPRHLSVGTVAENNRDASVKGRSSKGVLHSIKIIATVARGVKNKATKLSREAVEDIRSSSLPQRKLASKYGVSQMAVFNVIHRKSWGYV